MGRVSMDIVVVDVTEIKCRVGDVVTVIGKNRKDELRAADIAKKCGTTAYEFLTRLNPLLPRVRTMSYD